MKIQRSVRVYKTSFGDGFDAVLLDEEGEQKSYIVDVSMRYVIRIFRNWIEDGKISRAPKKGPHSV